MSIVDWVLFWPDTAGLSLFFHLFRQLCISALLYMALVIDPCVFTLYLVITSILEYTRRCSFLHLAYLHVVVAATFKFVSPDPPPTPIPLLEVILIVFKRAAVLLTPFTLENIFHSKIGFGSRLSDIGFPIIFSSFSNILSMIDPAGVSVNVAAFCQDYPDFSYLPLRIAGASFLSFFIALLATLTSRWKATRRLPIIVIIFMFQIPVFIVFVFGLRMLSKNSYSNVRVTGGIYNSSCESATKQLYTLPNTSDIVVLGRFSDACEQNQIEMISNYASRTKTLILSAFEGYLYAFTTDGSVKRLHNNVNDTTNRLFSYSKVMSINETFGRVLVLTKRTMLREEYYCSEDSDLIISFDGLDADEKENLPYKTATVVSQTTGASRIHFSNVSQSFLCNSEGHFVFVEPPGHIFTHNVRIYRNYLIGIRFRRAFSSSVTLLLGSFMMILVFAPRKILSRLSIKTNQIVRVKGD